jgi:hypothetical protein
MKGSTLFNAALVAGSATAAVHKMKWVTIAVELETSYANSPLGLRRSLSMSSL